MPSLIKVQCINCNIPFDTSVKRYHESIKNNWKFYCSKECLSGYRSTGKIVECANKACTKKVYRKFAELRPLNFCSSSCSAVVMNKLHPKRIKKLNYCANLVCQNQIPSFRKYCSASCESFARSKGLAVRKEEVMTMIKSFESVNRRIPFKFEAKGIYKSARMVFGTWNKAIEAAGYSSNPVIFSKKYIARDGHKCDSLSEMLIDNLLFSKGLGHKIHVPYPNQTRFKSDFLVGNTWIEFFGIYGTNARYTQLANEKMELIKKLKLNLVKLFPEDLFVNGALNKNVLDLPPLKISG